MQYVCPPGSSYWNPQGLWWLSQSWLNTAFIRIWMLVRLAIFIVGNLIDFAVTLIFNVFWPLAAYALTFAAAFFNFMIGLLLLEINIEWSIFVPLFLLAAAWIWWAIYPFAGCWIQDNIIPLLQNTLPFMLRLQSVLFILINSLITMWNAFVPLLGMLLAVMIELVILFFKIMVQLMGDGSLFKLFGLLQQIAVTLVQITIEVIVAITSISPAVIQALVNVIGYCMTIIIESVPFLIQITVWTFRILYFVLEPILDLLVSIAKMFRGGLVTSVRSVKRDAMGNPPPAFAQQARHKKRDFAPSSSSGDFYTEDDPVLVPQTSGNGYSRPFENDDDADDDGANQQMNSNIQYDRNGNPIYVDYAARSFGQYYTAESGAESSQELNDINTYFLHNPLGSHSHYFYLDNGEISELPELEVERHEYMTAKVLELHRGDFTYEHDTEDNDYSDAAADDGLMMHERQQRSVRIYHLSAAKSPRRTNSSSSKFGYHGNNNRVPQTPGRRAKIMAALKKAPKLKPLHHDFHKKVLCKSALCGGHGKALPHPVISVKADHNYRSNMFQLHRESHDDHRRRVVHTYAAMHALGRAVHHVYNHYYWQSDGSLEHHARRALKAVTGFDSGSRLLEHMMTRHEHPVDSVMSYVPILSEHWPFRHIFALYEGADRRHYESRFLGHWIRKRVVVMGSVADINQNQKQQTASDVIADALNGQRRLMHVTVETHEELERHEAGRQLLDFAQTGIDALVSPMLFVSDNSIPVKKTNNHIKDPNSVMTLPLFKFLMRDCVARIGPNAPALNPLCLPLIPAQLLCLVENIEYKIFNKFYERIQWCDYESQCADVGFCMPPRPTGDIFEILIIVNNIEYLVNWCWIRNGFVYASLVFRIVFPLLPYLLAIAVSQVPLLRPFLKWLEDLSANQIQFADLLCLLIYAYAPLLVVFLGFLAYIIIVPLFRFLWRFFTSLLAFFSAMMALEASRLATIESAGWYQLQERDFLLDPTKILRRDPFLVQVPRQNNVDDPGDELPSADEVIRPAMMNLRNLQTRIEHERTLIEHERRLVQGEQNQNPNQISVVGPITTVTTEDAAARISETEIAAIVAEAPVSKQARECMFLFVRSVNSARSQYGEPDESVTLERAHEFESAFGPLVQTLHYTRTWLNEYINETRHQAEKHAVRKPIVTHYWTGSAQPMPDRPATADAEMGFGLQ